MPPVEIVGLSDEPITVNDDLSIAKPAAPAADDKPAEDKPAEPVVDNKPAAEPGDKPADAPADDKPADDAPAEDKPAGDAPAEEKPAEDKPAEDKPAEGEPKPAEPSESDKLIEELGGAETVKSVQPLLESIDPDKPVSEKVAAIEKFYPEEQMKEIRNEVFWQAAETPEIQDLLAADPESQELFAQKNFGVPFAYVRKLIDDEKAFLSEDEFKAEADKFRKAEAPKQPPATKTEDKPAAEKKADDDKTQGTEMPPVYVELLEKLGDDVDKIVSAAQLEPLNTDDDTTRELKTAALRDFNQRWQDSFMADTDAVAAVRRVKQFADQGGEGGDRQARAKYPSLSAAGTRVAAQLIAEVSKPLAEHRAKLQTKAKSVAAARTESPKAANENQGAKAGVVDLTNVNLDNVDQAMADYMAKHPNG